MKIIFRKKDFNVEQKTKTFYLPYHLSHWVHTELGPTIAFYLREELCIAGRNLALHKKRVGEPYIPICQMHPSINKRAWANS